MFKEQVRRLEAFTLVELLVVVGILALLIGVLLPMLSRARSVSIGKRLGMTLIQSVSAGSVVGPATEPSGSMAQIRDFAADVTLTPRLSVGTEQPESIYEARFSAKLSAMRSNKETAESRIELPLPPQIISLGDLAVTVDGKPSDALSLREGKLLWKGSLPPDTAGDIDVGYTAVGKGLYAMEFPPSEILNHFQVRLTAKGSDVRMLELSMQPTSLTKSSGETVYNWDYKRLLFGRPIAVDVLGIAPIDRLGELSWLGPMSVVLFGLILGLVSRAYKLEQFDRWMLLLVLGTFTSAFPLMYFAQEFIPLLWAMIASGAVVLIIIALRSKSIIGWSVTIGGVVMPAAAIMGLTQVAAVKPGLQGMILTVLVLGMFIAAMVLSPRMHGQKREPGLLGGTPMPA